MKDYCKLAVERCDICQKKRRVTYLDRVPITPVPRAELPFTHWFMDLFGPLIADTNAASLYNYALVVIDSTSRFPFCTPLSNIAATVVCSGLLEIMSFVGTPLLISSDCGTQFTSQLTQELLSRLGCKIRFSTPYHPRGVGLSERCVSNLKTLICKLADEHPRSWHEYVKYALWALRETPNSTTGLSPFLLAFSRLPISPCRILAETWTGSEPVPSGLGQNLVDY